MAGRHAGEYFQSKTSSTYVFQKARSNFREMGLLCVVLFLQVPHKAHLEPVDILDVPKDDFQLVIVEHVYALPALTQIPLQQYEPQITARPSLILLLDLQLYNVSGCAEKKNPRY